MDEFPDEQPDQRPTRVVPPPHLASSGFVPPGEEPTAPAMSSSLWLIFALLGISATVGAGLLYVLGRFAIRFYDRGSLSFTLRAEGGWKFWLPGIILAGAVGGAVLLISFRSARPELPVATAWIFPATTIVAGLLVIAVYHDKRWWFIAPVVVWLALLIGTSARALLTEPDGFGHDVARTSLTVVSYVISFISLAMIYINKLRSVYSASAVAVLCLFLLLQMTDGEHALLLRRVVYAVAGALVVGQVTWIINYWSATGWTGGAFLLAVFYLVAGLSSAQLRHRVQVFDVAEFGGVALVAIAIVSAAVWFQS